MNNCSGVGVCQEDDVGHGFCECRYGYAGKDCSQALPCPNDCSSHGQCLESDCQCDPGYGTYINNGFEDMRPMTGHEVDCSQKLCLNHCSGKGTCEEGGACLCRNGFSGEDCTFKECPNNCGDHGVCRQPEGVCQCFPGFVGTACEDDECPGQCNGNGLCDGGCCVCNQGYTGVDCSLKSCPLDCSGRGTCNYLDGVCECFSPYFGEGCSQMIPPRVVVTPTEEVNETEPVELPEEPVYIEPLRTFSKLDLILPEGESCDDEEAWTERNGAALERVLAATLSVSLDDIMVHDVECGQARLGQIPAHANVFAEGTQEQSSAVTVTWSVVVVNDDVGDIMAETIVNALDSGTLVAALEVEGIEVEAITMKAEPMTVEPEDEYAPVDIVYIIPSESSSPTISPSPSNTPDPSISPPPSDSVTPTMTPSPSPSTSLVIIIPEIEPGMPEAEVKSAISLKLVLDMPYTNQLEWRELYEAKTKLALQTILGLTGSDALDRIVVERVERAGVEGNDKAVSIKFVVMPSSSPTTTENAMEEKMTLDDAGASGTLVAALGEVGVPVGGVVVEAAEVVTQPAVDVHKRCKRCRNGREQAEHDHREFTRKCNRAGNCKRELPFSVDDACARGCADHCAGTCKRFHDPKAKTCAIRRKFHSTNPGQYDSAMTPDPLVTDEAQEISNLAQVSRPMRDSIREALFGVSFLTLDQVNEGDNEAAVIAQCFTECSEACIETCIGQWSDAVPDPERTEKALELAEMDHAEVMLVANHH